MNISKEEYLKLLKDLAGEPDYNLESDDLDIPNESWIWGTSPEIDRLKKLKFQGTVDALHLHKDQIKKAIKTNSNIQVGPFSIKTMGYYQSEKLGNDIMSLEIYERRSKTPTNQPCNMDYRADLLTDKRFANRPWLTYFSTGNPGIARNVPIDTVVDIVKWMQALKKLTVFL